MKYYKSGSGEEVLAAQVSELTPGSGLLVHSASRTVPSASITSRGGMPRSGITPEGRALAGLGLADYVSGDTLTGGTLTQTVRDALVVALPDDEPFDVGNPPDPFAGTRSLQMQGFVQKMLGVTA